MRTAQIPAAKELDSMTLAVGALAVPLFLTITVGTWLLDAFVLWKVWTWHFVPLGAPVVTFGTMLAGKLFFSVVVAYLKPQRPDEGEWKRWGMHLLGLTMVLVVAWLVR